MKKSIFLLVCLIGMVSCSKTENLFDTERVKEEAKENFPTQDIDPDHDWNMAAVKTLKVSINQGFAEVYTVKVYTANPLSEQSDAKLMAKQEGVKDGATISLTFDIPKAMTYVYVLLEDKIYNRSVKMVDMSATAPQVLWGTLGRSARSANVLSRSVISYTSPNDADFFNVLPSDAIPYPETWTQTLKGNYYLEDCNFSNLHDGTNGTYNLFIKGTVSLGSNSWPSGTKVYVLPNSTLVMKSGLNLLAGTALYISKGGKLDVTNMQLSGEGYSQLYNRGTVFVSGRVEENSDGNNVIYNEGLFDASSAIINLTNSTTFINLSELKARQMVFSASGKLVNESGAEVTVTGETSLANNTNIIENNGTFTTTSLEVSGGMQLYNNCQFTVKGKANLRGTIQQDGQGYFEANEVEMGGMTINLGSESMFYVKSAMTYKGEASTITGIGDKAALLWVNGTCKCNWKSVTYGGNLKVAVKGHSPENSPYNIYYIVTNQAEIIGIGQVKLGTANGCGNSYTTNNGGTPSGGETPQIYTFAFEDITTEAGDFDFNDVVLKVPTIPTDGKMVVRLVAAGATKKLKVYYNNIPLFGGKEVHEAMGHTSDVMINTSAGVTADAVTDASIDWPETLTNANFSILDMGTNMYVKLPAFGGPSKPPYAIMVTADWDYPHERQRVDNKYPQFTEWAKDKKSNIYWYQNQ